MGGVVALIAVLLLFYFLRKRQRERARHREKPLNIIDQDEDGDDSEPNDHRRNDLPQFYQPEPFTVPDPTIAGSTADTDSISGSRRPLSDGTMTTSWYTSQRPGTPDGSAVLGAGTATSRKGAPPRMMRPVNIIQHDDAGPSYPPPPPPGEDEAETIELPPAYTALKTPESQGPPAASGSSS